MGARLINRERGEFIHISVYNVIVRPTKIMNNLLKDCKILTFKVIFLCQKSTESFSIFFSLKNIKKGEQLLLLSYFDNFDF